MRKLLIGLATAVGLAGTASAQVRPGDPIGSPAPTYTVEGLSLGSRVKLDSAMYREYKCGPSEQFDGFTWCQKTRRESERRGSFEASYSILHAKDGTVVYANRSQQPAFLDAAEADRDIQNYARKLGQPPQIAKMPHRSGTSDAILAVWGKIELEPLDPDSVRTLAGGKSPNKGFLLDFLGNFTRSAQEGLPIYRITGGAGFALAASFDQRGRGTRRLVAVDASALQPGRVATQQPDPPQNDDRQSEPVPVHPVPVQPAPVQPAQTQPAPVQPAPSQAEPAPAITARTDAEFTVERLQAELANALKAKTDAELARTEAEKAAQAARIDAQIARKEFEEARNDANAAKEEIDRLRAGDDRPAPYGRWIIISLGIFVAAIVFLIISAFSRMLTASPKQSAEVGTADTDFEAREDLEARKDPEAREDDVQAALIPLSTASETSAETEPSIHHKYLVEQLAKTLGVEAPVVPSSAEIPVDADCDQGAIEQREHAQADTSGAEASGPSKEAADPDDAVLLSSRGDGREEVSKSSVLAIPNAGEAEKVKPD
jgi:hypothetical protein